MNKHFREMRNYGQQTVMVTQSLSMFGRYKYRPAFQEWIYRLKKGERLPRGRYFVGKKPGRPMPIIDEFSSLFEGQADAVHKAAFDAAAKMMRQPPRIVHVGKCHASPEWEKYIAGDGNVK
ncbi:TPA: hypothetical protein ACIVGF_002869 [Salmonella enterica subsp. enterica serovar 16:l,v:-]